MCETMMMMSLLMDMSIACVWHNSRNLIWRFYASVPIVYALMYEFM